MTRLWALWVMSIGLAPSAAQQIVSVSPHVMPQAAPTKSKVQPRYGGEGVGGRKSPSGPNGKDLKSLLAVEPDGKDPHSQGFEPRPGPEEGGSKWTFGRPHAAVHHVLQHAVEGNASDVVNVLDVFSAEHGLSFGLGAAHGAILETALRRRLARAGEEGAETSGLNLLILQAGLGGGTLRCLPALLESGRPGAVFEVVSVEDDSHLSDGSGRLVTHALHRGDLHGPLDIRAVDVRHTPLMPAEGTVLEEVLETLQDGYEIKGFDLVLLGGSRKEQQEQLETLLEHGALRRDATIYSDGQPRGDANTERYLEFLQRSGGRFDYEVHAVAALAGSSSAVIVATLKESPGGAEL